jgi:hypothetical protein
MAPTQAVWDAHPEAQAKLEELPPVLHNDPDIRAVVYCYAREGARQEATVDDLIAQFFPQHATELGLAWWEALLRTTRSPAGEDVAQRRATVMSLLQKMSASPSGTDWVANVTMLAGAGWTYAEHVPGDASSPPEYTVLITLPFPPASSLYALTEALLREVTPAHLDIILAYSGGFVLDQSQLDQEPVI